MLLEEQLHGCSPRKTQHSLILEVLGLTPSEGGGSNHGRGSACSVLMDLVPCAGTSPPRALTASGQSFRQREGKFSTSLPETGKETQKSFAKGQMMVFVYTEGKRAAPILKGFTDGYFPLSLVYKIISLLGRFLNTARTHPGNRGRIQRESKPHTSTRDPQCSQDPIPPHFPKCFLFSRVG